MNRRLVAVFAFALVVAAATSFLVYRVIMQHVNTPVKTAPAAKLVTAAHDLQVGVLIHDQDLQEVAWGGPIPTDAIKTRAEAVGRGVVATIYRNEPILNERLAPKGAGAGLAATIPIGKRAVALRVNEVIGLAGFVLPGMRVDVVISGTVPSMSNAWRGTLARTILQNIEVLSAGQKVQKSVDGKPEIAQVVNLLVTPDQAEALSLASTEEKVQLVLRNPLDTEEAVTHGTSVAALFGEDVKPQADHGMPRSPAQPAAFPARIRSAPPDVGTVEVFTTGKRSEEKFQMPQENR